MNDGVKKAEAEEVRDATMTEHAEDTEAGAESVELVATTEAGETVEEITDPVEELRARVATLEDSLLRAKADCQNVQRRGAQERNEAVRYANAELIRSLLGVVDDFERSLAAADTTDAKSSVAEGVRLIYDNLMKVLRAHGLELIEAVDKPFDPHVHEAMMQQPSAEHPPDTVLTEVAKGYALRDRVLRPAKVIVSKDVKGDQEQQIEQASGEDARERGKKKKSKRKRSAT